MMTGPYFIGIDIGTQGARINLIDVKGNLISSAEEAFPLSEDSREEQSPEMWWAACKSCMSKILASASIDRQQILSMAVTSTSGTVIPLDKNHQPLHQALMYSDKRSAAQATIASAAALKAGQGFTAFNFSTGLAKMLWFIETFPEKALNIDKWAHAADFITGKISGCWGVTDYTNAFKSGYDVENYTWPSYLYQSLPLEAGWLPQVVASGAVIGAIDPQFAKEMDLPTSIKVVAGITDGCASQIASGAINPGEWNTTIGTTLVVKGVTLKEVKDPAGRIYSHRHPLGYWMPGGASNTGADWVTNEFGAQLQALNHAAEALIPTAHLAYPLKQKGERFPFIAPQALGFEPDGLSVAERFAANMEGVAYIERYAFELIEALSGEKVAAVFTAGGASNSDTWLKIRSNVMNLPIYKMKHISGAVGAAILAASQTHFTSLIEAAKALVQIEKEVFPEEELHKIYYQNYHHFLNTLLEKGYIKEGEIYA